MARTPDAVRSRRSRAHKRGDHSLCVPSRCPDALGENVPIDPDATIYDSVRGVVEPLVAVLAPDDPRTAGCAIALRLARDLDRQMRPTLVRELRSLLRELTDHPAEDANKLDEFTFARFERRFEDWLRGHEPVPATRVD